ncbi:hypothetical protein GA0115240_15597 [Streptomyces sp. DvalAA-14]|uniref:hypothetical protein n=1 Tax=unclassified Streptomyces TaxID=2593676 RepID=UPI00081B2E8C|nr:MULTISPECIES: hypothetical protein [unclassified Streptomyces]MYS23730.1 hypothetical protein [Streptomyces sp. SID4948]SCE37882.1 hypothetical protein GA0115240_15597 [Streptomyces sp. DvalAA-14]
MRGGGPSRVGAPAGRLRRFAAGEWGAVFPAAWRRLRARGARAVPLTLAGCVGVLALQLLQHAPRTSGWVDRLGGVYATSPWWQELLRTPLSVFVPDPSLPVWGLVLQLVVVFGIAETTLRTPRTLAIALLATLAGTCFARYSLWIGPHGFLGLPPHELRVRDTGPSAAVVALGVYTACRYRAWFTSAAIAAAMVVEVLYVPNLAGYEHLAGVAVILALTAAEAARRRTADRPGRPPTPSPPRSAPDRPPAVGPSARRPTAGTPWPVARFLPRTSPGNPRRP